MSNDSNLPALESRKHIDEYHKRHAFTLPKVDEVMIGPATEIRYTIGEKFDAGGFGDVFACVDEWGHSLVAKIIRPIGDYADTEAKALSEITAMALVRSPHIVHVHEAFVYRGACYIISERCNVTVREMLRKKPEHRQIYIYALIKSVLHALHIVHVQGLAHCDVHAGNVFLRFVPDMISPGDSSSIFKLGDFGLARPIASMNPSGTFHTSLLPPEVALREYGALDHRSDLYQAGLLFLAVLEGQETVWEVDEILAGVPRERAEAFGSPVADFVATLLRRHVDCRPASALEAWRAFEAAWMAGSQ